MSDSKRKNSYVIGMTPEGISGFLREIADEIEGKSDGVRQSVKKFRKLTLKLQRNGQRISADVKVWQNESEDKPEESGHSSLKKYRAAKKRLKPLFKDICRSVSKGTIPSRNRILSFFRDSDLMISFHGQEYYKEYVAAAEEFRAALDKGDPDAAKACCEKIKQIKSECHEKLK